MAKKDAASKRLAEEIARARARARYTLNLQRAFNDLLQKLNRAYGQPAGNAPATRSQHAVAQLAVARFLNQVGPDYLAYFANQFANLAQALNDLDNGIRAPILDLALAKKRSDRTEVWLARALVAGAVETKRGCGYDRESGAKWNRDSAAKWAAKKHPGLEQLITESGSRRSETTLEKAIISWCEDFSSHKIRNKVAAGVYDKLKAGALNCKSDQMEGEADRLLQEAVAFADVMIVDETNYDYERRYKAAMDFLENVVVPLVGRGAE
jgi:hypothetical protein